MSHDVVCLRRWRRWSDSRPCVSPSSVVKHIATRALANRSTEGYAATDTAWADHLDTAIEAARFRRLEDLYRTHKTGGTLGYGPAAERMAQVFDHIHDTVQARGKDTVVEGHCSSRPESRSGSGPSTTARSTNAALPERSVWTPRPSHPATTDRCPTVAGPIAVPTASSGPNTRTPLNDWLTRQHPSRTAWALQAVLALTDAAADVGWLGDMRHLPMVGALPTPSRTTPYLAIKQDNNGDTFLISPVQIPDIDRQVLVAEVTARKIGAWMPDESDHPGELTF